MRGLSASASVATSSPRTVAVPPSWTRRPSRISTVVVLPAPFGPEEAEDLASGDLEVDPVHRDQLAVALGQAGDTDDGVRRDVGWGMHGAIVTGPPVGRHLRRTARPRPASTGGPSKPPDQSMSRIVPPSRGPGVVFGRGRTQPQVRVDRPSEADVGAGELGQDPLLLEHVAVRLERVATGPDGRDESGQARLEDVVQPAIGGLVLGEGRALGRQPGAVLAQVVEEEPRLALERDDPGQPLQFTRVEPPVGDGHPQAERALRSTGSVPSRSRRPRTRGR